MPSWRSGHAAACRAALLPFKSGTWLGGFCGHSREVPPGPIPNPAVKLSYVGYCTEIREFSGTIQRCTPLLSSCSPVSFFCNFRLIVLFVFCVMFCVRERMRFVFLILNGFFFFSGSITPDRFTPVCTAGCLKIFVCSRRMRGSQVCLYLYYYPGGNEHSIYAGIWKSICRSEV